MGGGRESLRCTSYMTHGVVLMMQPKTPFLVLPQTLQIPKNHKERIDGYGIRVYTADLSPPTRGSTLRTTSCLIQRWRYLTRRPLAARHRLNKGAPLTAIRTCREGATLTNIRTCREGTTLTAIHTTTRICREGSTLATMHTCREGVTLTTIHTYVHLDR